MKEHFFLGKGDERPEQLERIERTLERLPADRGYRVEVHEQSGRRSDQQNRFLWGCVYPHILKQGGERLAGWTAQEIHEWCLGECFGWETVAGFGSKKKRPLKRSSGLNKQDFADFVAWIQRRMAEFGIVIPDPDPEWYLKEVG